MGSTAVRRARRLSSRLDARPAARVGVAPGCGAVDAPDARAWSGSRRGAVPSTSVAALALDAVFCAKSGPGCLGGAGAVAGGNPAAAAAVGLRETASGLGVMVN